MISNVAGVVGRVLAIWSAIMAATRRIVIALTDYNPWALEIIILGSNYFIRRQHRWAVKTKTPAYGAEILLSGRSGALAIFQHMHTPFRAMFSDKHYNVLAIEGSIKMTQIGKTRSPCIVAIEEYHEYHWPNINEPVLTGCLLKTEIAVPFGRDGHLRLTDLVKAANGILLPMVQEKIKERTDGNA